MSPSFHDNNSLIQLAFSEADLCTEKPDFIVHDFRDLLDLTE